MTEPSKKVVDLVRKPNAGGDEGMGVVLEFTVARGQNLQLSTCLRQNGSVSEWNTVLDKMRVVGERQGLITGIDACEQAIRGQRIQERKHRDEDGKNLDEYMKAILTRSAKIDALKQMKDRASISDQESFQRTERRGAYKVSDDAKKRMQELDGKIFKEEQAADEADVRRKEQERDLQANLNSFAETIILNQDEIERARAKLAEIEKDA